MCLGDNEKLRTEMIFVGQDKREDCIFHLQTTTQMLILRTRYTETPK